MLKIFQTTPKEVLRFLGALFSVCVYDNTHIKITLFGIKIKIPRPKYSKLKKQNPFYKYKSENRDITKLPPAKGDLRDIQLANMILLKEIDYVCRQNNLSYWLDGGTMLGAVRHKGFIPWDDDIDVGMMIDDYEKIIEAFEQSSRDKDIYAAYYKDEKHPDMYFIKVKHKKCPALFIDIFPFYIYGKAMNVQEQLEKTKEIKAIRKKLLHKVTISTPEEEIKSLYYDIMKKIIPQTQPERKEDTDLVWGVQYNHNWKNWFTNYNVIFPLKPMEFEGCVFWGINNPDAFLSRLYGEYMSYPPNITFGHNVYKDKEPQELEIIKTYAKRFELGKK